MRADIGRRILSFFLVAGGSFLLFLGAREFLESRFGQSEAAREFQQSQQIPPAPPDNSSPDAIPAKPEEPVPPPQTGEAIAKLIIPRLAAELYVVEGDGARELRRGPGHLTGTAMPGANGNCVIAGHRDTHFRVLKDIQRGDDIVLETRAGQYLYRVKNTRVVSPKNTEPLQPTASPELNLITCYPFYYVGSAPKRFVVEAQLAGAVNTEASAGRETSAAREPSW